MVRVGIIGVGYWGPNIVRNLYAMKSENGVEIAGVCDLSPAALSGIQGKFPDLPLFSTFDELVAKGKPDAVIIVTPAGTHAALAKQALSLGLHVFVEKPLATNVADAKALVTLAQEKGLTLLAGHTFLYSKYVRTVKRLIDSGEIGKIRFMTSERMALGQIRSDVDVLWNLGPHDISILNYLAGSVPGTVSGWGISTLDPARNHPDVVFGKLDYPGGITAHVHLSWLHPVKVRKMIIVGTDKMIVYDDTDTKTPVQVHDKAGVLGDKGRFTTRSGEVVPMAVDLPEPLGVELAHFVSCIRSGETPLTGGVHALNVVAVLESLSRSIAKNGEQVRVPVFPENR
ncbi:MAG: Gfo/Idh/MocA family oxidoreductase [Methanoregulaceae archaeon]